MKPTKNLNNMTAVEIFFQDLVHLGYIEYPDENLVQDRLKLAKELEKQQIIDAAANHCYPTCELARIDAEQYYSETYKKDKDMATIYKVEVTSHWISYSKEELEKILTEAVKKIEFEKGNTIQIRVEDKK
jgi:hypothetical protein